MGEPVSCTGILTDSVRRVIGEIPEHLVVSRIRKFKLVAPGGRSLYVDLDKVNLILDRAGFDRTSSTGPWPTAPSCTSGKDSSVTSGRAPSTSW